VYEREEVGMNQKKVSKQEKARIVLEALREVQTIGEISQKYGIHPNQIIRWKKQALENFDLLFEDKRCKPKEDDGAKKELEAALKKLGQTTMEVEWLKKKLGPYL